MQGGANHKPKVVCFTRIRACTRWSQALVQFRGQGLYGAHKDSSDFYFLFFKKKLKGKASLSKNETPTRLVGTTFIKNTWFALWMKSVTLMNVPFNYIFKIIYIFNVNTNQKHGVIMCYFMRSKFLKMRANLSLSTI